MGKATPWHEDDSFWEATGPVLFPERRMLDTPGEVDRIVALLGLEPGARVLDLCCGVGRHSLELARRGYAVTAVDRTGAYLERACRQAREEGLDVEFAQADMREFRRADSFDAVLNLFTSFGYFKNQEDDYRVARNIHESLKASGILLMDMMGKEILARIFRERTWDETDGLITLQEHKLSRNWGWMEGRWIIMKGDERREFTISHRLYSAVELTALLSECGFTASDVYGDLTSAPYDHNAKRLVVLAHKLLYS